MRETLRLTSSSAAPDGSFRVTMEKLLDEGSVRLPDGRESEIEGYESNAGFRLEARVSPLWRAEIEGFNWPRADARAREVARRAAVSSLNQVLAMQPLTLAEDRSAKQTFSMHFPVTGDVGIDVKVIALHRLIKVENGLAHIQLVHQMDFGVPKGDFKISAEGNGGGTLIYDITKRSEVSLDSFSFITVVMDDPKGVMEVKLQMSSSDKTVTTAIDIAQ